MTRSVMYLGIVGVLLILSGCGKSSTAPDTKTPEDEITSAGWVLYESGDYTAAIAKFQECIEAYPDYAEAYAGAAWASLDNGQFAQAKSFFTTGNTKNPSGDALYMMRIGLSSILLLDSGTPSTVGNSIVSNLSSLVSISNSWVHPHNSLVTAIDLHTLLAEGYIKCGPGYYGNDIDSVINALDAWGQVKKALAMNPSDQTALRLQNHLKGL